MKTTSSTLTTSTPDFPGIVIDPETGRKCALMTDIMRGMGLAGNQISVTGARIYQSRFHDILDVIEARSKMGKSGRGRRACHRRMQQLLCQTTKR